MSDRPAIRKALYAAHDAAVNAAHDAAHQDPDRTAVKAAARPAYS